MINDRSPATAPEGRVLRFRRRTDTPARPPVAGLDKYQQSEEREDYRHRMLVNLAAFAFVLALMGAGYWLADSMARLRKNQDCVLSGRPGCAPVEYRRER